MRLNNSKFKFRSNKIVRGSITKGCWVVFYLFISSCLFAQTPSDTAKKTNKFKKQAGLFFSFSKANPWGWELAQSLNFRPGINFEYAINNRLTLTTGILCNISTQKRVFQSYGYYKVVGYDFQLPVLLNYRFQDKKISPLFHYGVIASNRTLTKYTVNYSDGISNLNSVNHFWGIRSIDNYTLNLRLGFGIAIKLKRYPVNLFPIFETAVDRFLRHPNYYGLATSFSYSF